MSTFYFISLVITAGLSVLITLIAPQIKMRYTRIKRAKKQKLNELIAQEVERQIKQIVND
jgi:cellobiose-specific phosphotransferase system component IIB